MQEPIKESIAILDEPDSPGHILTTGRIYSPQVAYSLLSRSAITEMARLSSRTLPMEIIKAAYEDHSINQSSARNGDSIPQPMTGGASVVWPTT